MLPSEFTIGVSGAALVFSTFLYRRYDVDFPKDSTEWLSGYFEVQINRQVDALSRLTRAVLPELVESYFGIAPLESAAIPAGGLSNAAGMMSSDPGRGDAIFRRQVTLPVFRAILTPLMDELPRLAPDVAQSPDVLNALLTLRCHSAEAAGYQRLIAAARYGYLATSTVALVFAVTFLLYGFFAVPIAGQVAAASLSVGVIGAVALELVRARLRGALTVTKSPQELVRDANQPQ